MILNNAGNIRAPSLIALLAYTQTVLFTPTVSGTTIVGTGTYTTQEGIYYKMGKIVFANINLTWTAHTGTGSLLLTSLPLPCINTSNFTPTFAVMTDSIVLPLNSINILGQVTLNTSQASLYATRTNTTKTLLAMASSGTIQATIIYQTT